MPWIPRGLREGIVTTRYPRHPDDYGPAFQGAIAVDPEYGADPAMNAVAAACPTGAISVAADRVQVDRGRCILCGRCASLFPEAFRLVPALETSAAARRPLIVPVLDEDGAAVDRARRELSSRTRALRRSIQIRHVDAGSDGADEWEVAALTNPVYDVQRLGIFFTASPRHADILLVTGVGSAAMLGPVRQTFEAMPDPRVVIAAGVDAISGGLLGDGYAARGGVAAAVPVDVWVPGSPAAPFSLLHGILLAVGRLGATPARGGG
jgi:Ni,Fe-hydrogenase III small subunit/ferredoxin